MSSGMSASLDMRSPVHSLMLAADVSARRTVAGSRYNSSACLPLLLPGSFIAKADSSSSNLRSIGTAIGRTFR